MLELDESMEAVATPPVDLGPPLLEEEAAGESRSKLEELANVAAAAPPPPQINPLEEMVREMLRPILKQWLDDHLPGDRRRACEARNSPHHRPALLRVIDR